MSETVAIQFIEAMSSRNIARVKTLVTDESAASGGVLVGKMPISQPFQLMSALWMALPDFHCEIMNVETQGIDVIVIFFWGGTHSGTLALPMPEPIPPVPPTQKQVWVPDAFIFSFQGDRISAARIASPASGGIPGLLMQLGVALPHI